MLDNYAAALESAPLSDQTRRTYASKVRQFLAWLPERDSGSDPLNAKDARDWAVRDYRTHLQAVLKRKPATVNNALAAIDDLYMRLGLGSAIQEGRVSHQVVRLERAADASAAEMRPRPAVSMPAQSLGSTLTP